MNSMVEAEIWTIARTEQGNAVLIRPIGQDISIPVFIGQFEAQSILIGYGEVVIPRPLTHDLILNLIHRLGLELSRVELYDLRDGTFYARLILSGKGFPDNRPLIIDSRPSDAFALAVRSKCPVFVSRKVVDEAGLPVDFIINAADGSGPGPSAFNIGDIKPEEPGFSGAFARQKALQAELEEAVSAEDYERAAELRDILALLEKEGGKESSKG
jgi:bifunctional DNase/RNase